VQLLSTDAASSIVFNSAAPVTLTSNTLNLNAESQSLVSTNGLAFKTLGSISTSTTNGDLVVNAGSEIDFVTEGFGSVQVAATQDLYLSGSLTSVNSAGAVTFDASVSLTEYASTSLTATSTTTTTVTGTTINYNAGVFTASSPNTVITANVLSIKTPQAAPVTITSTGLFTASGKTVSFQGQTFKDTSSGALSIQAPVTSFTSTSGSQTYSATTLTFAETTSTFQANRDFLVDSGTVTLTDSTLAQFVGNTVHLFGSAVSLTGYTTVSLVGNSILTTSDSGMTLAAPAGAIKFTVAKATDVSAVTTFAISGSTATLNANRTCHTIYSPPEKQDVLFPVD